MRQAANMLSLVLAVNGCHQFDVVAGHVNHSIFWNNLAPAEVFPSAVGFKMHEG